MPWSLSNLPNSVKNKSKELKEIFIEVSNRSLSEGKDDEASLFAGLAAVSNAERKKAKEIKKQVLEDKARASYVPEHLRLIQEAKALKELIDLVPIFDLPALIKTSIFVDDGDTNKHMLIVERLVV